MLAEDSHPWRPASRVIGNAMVRQFGERITVIGKPSTAQLEVEVTLAED